MSTIPKTSTDSVFDISLESIAKTISYLSIEGLGEINTNTNLFSHWPSADQWQSYQQKVTLTILHELPSAEKEEIEANLAAIDSDFNNSLEKFVQFSTEENGTEKTSQVVNYLYDLLDRCESLQKQIYEPTSPIHHTYPYFAHSFLLYLAVIKACTCYKNEINEPQLIQGLLNQTIFYISAAEKSAYSQRKAEIKQRRGGARSELIYVQDSLFQESLTEWYDVGEKFQEIDALYQYLQSKVPLDYVQTIPFTQGYEIIGLLIGNSSDAKTGQITIERDQGKWAETVESTWEVAESSAVLLLRYAPQDATQRLVAAKLSDKEQEMIAEASIALITGVIGSLPIPGAALFANTYGLLLGWITNQGKEDPWKQVEDSLKKYTDQAVLGLELTIIKNDLAFWETQFDVICKDITTSNWKPGNTLNSELATRLINCYDAIKKIQYHLYNPYSQKHTTLPYFERCSTLYFAVMPTVVQCLKSYDLRTEYETFFNRTYNYLHDAYLSAGEYRRSTIKYKWGGFFNHLNYVRDNVTGRDLTDWWDPSGRYNVIEARYNLLYWIVPCFYESQMGIRRMFASFDSLVNIYNQKLGKKMPLLTPFLDKGLSNVASMCEGYVRTATNAGYPSAGVRFGLFKNYSLEEFKGATFYVDAYYQGLRTQLTVGGYPDITKIGIPENCISSVKVPNRWKVTLYEQRDFKGASKEFISDTKYVGDDFNDKASSIKVEIDLYQ
ncbi:hypothetical protein H6G80_11495 [Nostoc sp. FACHB-87]|uniref:hypothetical protein n=1 Tax=Nostocaceae TaxID=1162 RepID=UPI0016822C0F|nr:MULTISPECIES: hypothetical protein [Nostocaceae]MBD2454705.1 hypothetical protein [Nostoc sp. FACHB-87]MBD2475876.1 hypothetical protein [Anabaena sp. FACHB-83]